MRVWGEKGGTQVTEQQNARFPPFTKAESKPSAFKHKLIKDGLQILENTTPSLSKQTQQGCCERLPGHSYIVSWAF